MRLKQKIHDVIFHLDVESKYNDPVEGESEIVFTMGQYTEHTDLYTSMDADISASVEEAKRFAYAILKACNDIENATTKKV